MKTHVLPLTAAEINISVDLAASGIANKYPRAFKVKKSCKPKSTRLLYSREAASLRIGYYIQDSQKVVRNTYDQNAAVTIATSRFQSRPPITAIRSISLPDAQLHRLQLLQSTRSRGRCFTSPPCIPAWLSRSSFSTNQVTNSILINISLSHNPLHNCQPS